MISRYVQNIIFNFYILYVWKMIYEKRSNKYTLKETN